MSDVGNRTHGRLATYALGCRCDECRTAKREYARTNLRHRAHQRARQRAATWVRANHPEVYQAFVAVAIEELKAERRAAA